MMGNVDERQKRILEDLTSILLKQTFIPIVENLKGSRQKRRQRNHRDSG